MPSEHLCSWFFDKSTADLGIKKVTNDNKVIVQNYGGLPITVLVYCEFADGTTELYKESTAVWSNGDSALLIQVNKNKMIKKVVIGNELIPDVDESNNSLEIDNN